MSTFTCTSRIKSKVDVSERFDMSAFNLCVTHGRKPTIFEIKWGRRNKELTAECESEDCLVFGDLPQKWNRFNPVPAPPLITQGDYTAAEGDEEGRGEVMKSSKPKRRKCLICRLVITRAKVCKSNEYICQPCMNGESVSK